jgi:hypothetical protein
MNLKSLIETTWTAILSEPTELTNQRSLQESTNQDDLPNWIMFPIYLVVSVVGSIFIVSMAYMYLHTDHESIRANIGEMRRRLQDLQREEEERKAAAKREKKLRAQKLFAKMRDNTIVIDLSWRRRPGEEPPSSETTLQTVTEDDAAIDLENPAQDQFVETGLDDPAFVEKTLEPVFEEPTIDLENPEQETEIGEPPSDWTYISWLYDWAFGPEAPSQEGSPPLE